MAKRVLIADKNRLLLKTYSQLIYSWGFEVVGATSDESNLMALVKETKPDLLLYDLNLSDNGVTELSLPCRIKEEMPEMKILITGFHEAVEATFDAFIAAGFHGFCNKCVPQGDLRKTLESLFA